MKDFLKMVLAVICGLLLASIISSLFLFGCAGAMAGSGSKPVLPRTGVLKMDLSKVAFSEQVTEQPDFASVLRGGEMITPLSLRQTVDAIGAAANDPTVQFIYLKADGANVTLSQAEELRQALVRFRESGKAVVAYTESPGTGSIYLASAADKIMMSDNCGASLDKGETVYRILRDIVILQKLFQRIADNKQARLAQAVQRVIPGIIRSGTIPFFHFPPEFPSAAFSDRS